MPSTHRRAAYAAQTLLAITLSASTVRAADLNAMTYVGCFSSSQPLSDQGSYEYQTSGYCQPICVKQGQAVLGLSGGSDCWCGGQIPAQDTKVSDSNCNAPCDGYDKAMCGGTNYWSVYLSGTNPDPGYDSDSSGGTVSSPTSTTSTPAPISTTSTTTPPPGGHTNTRPSVVTSKEPGTTIVVTRPADSTSSSSASPTPQKQSSGGSTNVAGIAAGVVVGVIAAAAIFAGLFFYLRRKRRQAAEDEYKRSTQVAEFMGGGDKRPPPTGYSTTSDSRLDPEFGMRRNSVGSMADERDYSRRILKVANPDGTN